MAIGLGGDFASRSYLVQDLFRHEHVAHGNTSIEITQKREFGGLGQFVVLYPLSSIMIGPIRRVLHRQPHLKFTQSIMHVTRFPGSRYGQVFLAIPSRKRSGARDLFII